MFTHSEQVRVPGFRFRVVSKCRSEPGVEYGQIFIMKAVCHIVLVVTVLAVVDCAALARANYCSLSVAKFKPGTPVWVAKEEGFYKRFGVDADLILFEGSTRGAQALISGDLPIIGMAGQAIISARARGADLVAVTGMVNRMNYIFVGSPSVKTPEDLKGKRIGTSQIGTASYHGVVLALKQWHLDARRDRITILQVGTQAARMASINSGGSDAIIVNPGLSSAMKDRGYRILADFSELPMRYPCSFVDERALSQERPGSRREVNQSICGGKYFYRGSKK